MERTIHFKIFYAEQIRRLALTEPSYATLREALQELFPFASTDKISIKYKDDEDDLVTISSDVELDSAISLLGSSTLLRLHVFASPIVTSSPVPPIATPDQISSLDSFKRVKKERKLHKKMYKKQLKEGHWNRHITQENWRSEKREWKRLAKLAKKSPEKQEFIRKFNAVFEPCRTVVEATGTPFNFNSVIKNIGSETWPEGTILKPVGKCKAIASAPSLDLPGAFTPQLTLPISFKIDSPASGAHVTKWRLFLPDGKKFGPKLFLKIRSSDSMEKRKSCGKRGMRCGGRGRGGGHGMWMQRDIPARFTAHLQNLRELGYDGPHVVRLLHRYRGDINQVLDHLAIVKSDNTMNE
eukprot:TRINITY_DN192_c0_g1_i1.p1 TRINITY_DN192_c0_g1~~TRINITY_DN192_c0_g1_i1.p1  ORF type:complete len:354 (+),score=69.41 TRINITY_DN192_c0_g1_i1:137-1198(+)